MKFSEYQKKYEKSDKKVYAAILKKNPHYDLENEISNVISHLRLDNGLTQVQLAKRCKTKQPGIARAESHGVANIKFLNKLAMAMGYKLKITLEKNA